LKTIEGIEGLCACVGEELGVSEWRQLDQSQISAFADCTGDQYWIHTDPDRAATTARGTTIAHGLLTLSLGPVLSYEIFEITGVSVYLNYGYGKVRFTAPVPVGSRIRLRAILDKVDEAPGGITCTVTQVFELEGSERPACVAESIFRVIS
jgi:acyl dehydratase